MITLRNMRPGDLEAIKDLHRVAFQGPTEAGIVDMLQVSCPDLVSLVAIERDRIVGHILFSPVTIETRARTITGMGLGPMAVLPEYQRQGIGSQLVTLGLEVLRRRNCPFVVVLGHPDYYPRFGFRKASAYGLKSQWEGVPDEAFMVIVLDGDVMKNITGVVIYRDEFNEAIEEE